MLPQAHISIPQETRQLGLTLTTTLTSDTAEHPREINVHEHGKMQRRVFIAALFTEQAGKTTVAPTSERRTGTQIGVES